MNTNTLGEQTPMGTEYRLAFDPIDRDGVLDRLRRLPGAVATDQQGCVDFRRTSQGSMPDATFSLVPEGAYFCIHGGGGAEILGLVVSSLLSELPAVRIEPLDSDDGRAVVHEEVGWIPEDGLRPFLELTSEVQRYSFDDDDWGAFVAGLEGTDAESGAWFEYLLGTDDVNAKVRVAHDPGTSVLMVSVAGSIDVCRQAALAIAVVQRYRLSARR